MSESAELYTIGRLARRTGLSVHTIRFWSDSGLVPPAGRSAGGYRLYDAAAVARLELVQSLRELGIPLDTVQDVLARHVTVAEVADAHAQALDAEIRTLKLRRAVLRTIAERGGTPEETLIMHRLARLSATERQQIINRFVDDVFAGVTPDDDALTVAGWMRELPAELPDDPSPAQVDAWVELAELVADEDFRDRLRRIVLTGTTDPLPDAGFDLRSRVLRHAGQALTDQIAPASPEARPVLDRVVDPRTSAQARDHLRDRLELLADPRAERYWHLLSTLDDRPPSPTVIPAFTWTIAALRAHA
ncbi:MerR family transcriptional regulator [Sphaerisporangium sp. TRM90804]|uniref:helix-turn-helix domain-containing protein n=1 Tax=Sphaerisporangium sp. TRM90804 TaxID=3031113 RepID=UPI002449AE44|nr:MerR family transcriptional regulator [Sphaerisporangium sp. TRM90804]MDH2430554.1 MerR family transcriptional regulator [Sphaerisporangium sp. TRM90804]